MAYYIKGDFDRAFADFTKAIELEPGFAQAYVDRGNIAYFSQQFAKAITDYSRAIDLDPNNAEAYSRRGLAYKALDKKKEAIADLEIVH